MRVNNLDSFTLKYYSICVISWRGRIMIENRAHWMFDAQCDIWSGY